MDNPRQFRENLNRHFSQIGKALSSHKRLELLDLLRQAPKSVDVLAENTAMSAANTSQHLQVLRAAGLVESSRAGTRIVYKLSSELVWDLVRQMRQVAETHLAEVDRALARLREDQHSLLEVDRERLSTMASAGQVIILDVRPSDEFEAAHLPFAVSIPLDQLEDHLDRLPVEQKIVAYCRSPYCLLAGQAVRMLRRRGYQANELGVGVTEWRDEGHEVIAGEKTD